MMTSGYVDRVLAYFGPGDVMVCQNEINLMEEITDKACQRRIRIALNPSPINAAITPAILRRASWIFVNEIEAAALAPCGQGLCYRCVAARRRAFYPLSE